MKLRTRRNSIRLRLTRSEVAAVARGERVEEIVDFAPGERLVFALACEGELVSARFQPGSLVVRVPTRTAAEWGTSERVGIAAEQVVEPGTVLSILIEKDFACLTAREGEDDVDAFPNPNERC